jgi:predicted RNA-binding protein with PIN domain
VIFTEVDFETFDERIARKLFVGATRATMKLIVVASQRAARHLHLRDGKETKEAKEAREG